MAVLSVSDAELKRLEVLRDVDRGGLPVRAAALWIVRQNYADFGPTLAAEKLAESTAFHSPARLCGSG